MKRTFIAVALVAAGCGKKSDEKPEPRNMEEADVLSHLPAIEVTPEQEEVLVRINDNTLTRKDLDLQVRLRLGTRASGLSPDQLHLAQQQLGPKILEQFIAQSVLMKAAEEAGIEVSEEEKSEAFARLDEQLQAQGSSLEESLKNTPVGESFLKDELVRGLHINRYLAERLPEIPQPTDAEVDAVISRIPETVHARHILIQHADTDDAEARAAKREKAEGLRTQLLEGADFAELARQHSEGPSAPRGGDLGRFHRGKMVPPFENAAFSQEVGEIGEIVETRFGFHIIQVIDHVTAGAAPRDQIVEQLRAQNRSKMVVDLVKELMTDADVEFATSVIPLVPPAFRRAE